MNFGQIILVLAAFVILGSVSLSVNGMFLNKEITMLESKVSLMALDLAESFITEIKSKSFDEATAGGTKADSAGQFTLPASLGPSITENVLVPKPESPDTAYPYKSITKYNDIDDYHGYSRRASTDVGYFTLQSSVCYVQEANLNLESSVRTYFKRITVSVTNPNMKATHQFLTVVVYRK